MSEDFSYAQVIAERASWRTYDGQPLAEDLAGKLRARLTAPPAAPFGSSVVLDLLTDFDAQQRGVGKLGTYGIIKGARNYLVGRVVRGPRAMEDFGYLFEWAILQATALGLGSCWLGGTLKRGAFGRAVGAGPDQIIPAVSPVGQAVARRRALDRIMRWGAGSAMRKDPAELFFLADFGSPVSLAGLGEWGRVLELVRLSPSASNKQPWRVVRAGDGGAFHLFVARDSAYSEAARRIGKADLQRIDLGIALSHLELGARAAGLEGRWSVEPPGLELPAGTEYVASWLASP